MQLSSGKIGPEIMTESAALNLTLPASPTPPLPTAEAIAAARREPRFKQSVAIVAVGNLEYYQRRWLANRVLNDRGRFGMALLIMFLHFTYRPEIANSGVTAARVREACVGIGLCGGGRVESMLLLMRASGFLERAEDSGRHERRYVPTPKLVALLHQRHHQVLSALDILRGDTDYLTRILGGDEEAVYPRFVMALGRGFLAGYRVVNAAPDLLRLIDRDAGLPMMMCVLLASPEYAPLAPEEMRPTSVAGLARRFNVSRIHVRSVLRDAESVRFLMRHGATEQVTALPNLITAMENFFANGLVFAESCAQIALTRDV